MRFSARARLPRPPPPPAEILFYPRSRPIPVMLSSCCHSDARAQRGRRACPERSRRESAVHARMQPSKRNVSPGRHDFTACGKRPPAKQSGKGRPSRPAEILLRPRSHQFPSCCHSDVRAQRGRRNLLVIADPAEDGISSMESTTYLPGSVNSGFGIGSPSSSFCRCSRRALLMFTDASSSFFPSSLRSIRIRICPRK